MIQHLALALTIFMTACAHKSKAPSLSGQLFPHGTYQSKLRIQIIDPARTVDLRGVITSKPEELKVVGLSTFNSTVFRIDENLKTKVINKEFYVETLRRNEDRFLFFYSLLKEVLLAQKGATEFEKHGAKFLLSKPDENQIYRNIQIIHPQVNLTIDITGYEF